MDQAETIIEPKYHYWFATVRVTGPLPHEIKEIPITLRTTKATVSRAQYEGCVNHAIAQRAEEVKCDPKSLRGVLFGPNYVGAMTQVEFEGADANGLDGEKQG